MSKKVFFVEYNGKYLASYKTLKGCLSFIDAKKLRNDFDNDLLIVDNEGNIYNPINGQMK